MAIKTYSATYLIYFTVLFLSSLSIRPADGSAFESLNNFDENSTKQTLLAQGEKGMGSNVQTRSRLLLSTEILLTSISGEIYLNPKHIGRIVSTTPLGTGNSSSSKREIEFNQTKNLWPVVIVPQSISNLEGLNVTGEEGSISISRSDVEKALNLDNNELKTITKPKVAFGQLSSTILFTDMNVNNPSKFEIGVFDFKDNKFINGDIIALTNNQMAVKFENLPSTVISKEGKLRYSLKDEDGSFINSEMNAWGCELVIPDTQVGKNVPIKAQIFGLPDEAKVKFTFQPVEGQKYSLPVSTLSVREINSGQPITMISTSIAGNQLISVTVEESL
jgi:hypothetical protein